MNDASANWDEIRKLLNDARRELPPDGLQPSTTAAVGLLTGTLGEFQEFLDHNELELAWDALAAVADRIHASPTCWRKLACAAGLMRLLGKEKQAAQRATPRVPCEQALAIARHDAEKAYRELFG